ncbi:MAG: integrase core domain-containing protein, partial [Pseudomonadota bacterium]
RWRHHYNTVRPHSALGYRPPAPETLITLEQRPAMHQQSTQTNQVRPVRPHCPRTRGC